MTSELMCPEPHPAVLAWLAPQPRATLYTASIKRGEVLSGVASLPVGRRRSAFKAVVTVIFAKELASRVLPFNGTAAEHYARIVTAKHAAGRPIEGWVTEDHNLCITVAHRVTTHLGRYRGGALWRLG